MVLRYITKGRMEFFLEDSEVDARQERDGVRCTPKLSDFTDLEIIEMVANITYSETGDFDFCMRMAMELAFRLGLDEYLRLETREALDYYERRLREE